MQIISHGAAQVVTGSCHELQSGNSRILIDCGMFQGSKELNRLNYRDFPFRPSEINSVVITHGHIDHCGLLPKLVKLGFKGPVYMSAATADLVPIMLEDAAFIQEKDTEHENHRRIRNGEPPRDPLYTLEDAKAVTELIRSVEYLEPFVINNEFECTLHDAGHVIGSAIAEIICKNSGDGKTAVFSGDIGQVSIPIIEDPSRMTNADYVYIESTYGDTVRDNKIPRDDELYEYIMASAGKGGKLLIPSFALERTQELLYSISRLRAEKKDFPKVPVYLDSPLAIKITEVFKKHPEIYDEEARGRAGEMFSFPGLVCTPEVEQSKSITKSPDPCIVIAGSGMCTAGRIRHHIRHGIEDPANILLFVGYQAAGTLGRLLLDGVKDIKMMGRRFTVRARIARINSFSAHADQNGLLSWLEAFEHKPATVFTVHGEPETVSAFASLLRKKGYPVQIPVMDEPVL
ncbi:MAG: MBL fold metallo-hydrolase [Spirochaetales bacterium]|nr:MBL fold metallo-hydrolase [Spirochaetales bacterium]